MSYIGVHVSIAGGIYKALQRAKTLDINTVQIFLKNARKWNFPEYTEKDINRFRSEMENFDDLKIFAHAGYLINLASRDLIFNKTYKAFLDEIRRAESLGIEYIVVHPGQHKGKGETQAIHRIARSLDKILKRMTHTNVKVLLETTAGNGTSVGYRFEHLRDIMDFSRYSERIAVCLDTCHIFAAGYSISDEEGYHNVINDFNRIIGLKNLKLIHLNDSRGKLGSRIDRHAHIGRGAIGDDAFRLLLNDERLKDIPKILETPKIISSGSNPNVITKDIPLILETSRKLGLSMPDTLLKDIPQMLETSRRIALSSSEVIFKEILKTLENMRGSGSSGLETSLLKDTLNIFKDSKKLGFSIPETALKEIQKVLMNSMSLGVSVSDNILKQVLKILKSTRISVYEVDMMNLRKVYSLMEQREKVI